MCVVTPFDPAFDWIVLALPLESSSRADAWRFTLDLVEIIFLWTCNGSLVVGVCLSQVSEQTGICTIFTKNAQDVGNYQDLPLCGTLVVYDTRSDTINSLSAEEREEQPVR